MIILRTGILYSIIVCAFISFSSLYSSFLISLKTDRSKEDGCLSIFLNIFGIYWLIYMFANIFAWLNMPPVVKELSFFINALWALAPLPLILYFTSNRGFIAWGLLIGFAYYFNSFSQMYGLTTISYWGVQIGANNISIALLSIGIMLPLMAFSLYKIFSEIKKHSKLIFIESIAFLYALLGIVNMLSPVVTRELLLLRMLYVIVGFVAYFYLSGEEATVKFAGRISPWIEAQVLKLRRKRIPFFVKLLMLFMLLSVLPIAAAGYLMFITFREIIDLYIYKPLLWNLKTSKEEFLLALNNVQVQALFLLILTIILVVMASGIASRAISQSLRRIGKGMKRLEEGDLAVKVSPESNDEIGDLANYFNRMAAEIKRSREIMENWNKELEKKVSERTKDLQTLYNITKSMGSTLDLDQLLSKSISYMPTVAGSNKLSIFLIDKDGIFTQRVNKGFDADLKFKSGEGLLGATIAGDQIVKTADVNELLPSEKEKISPLGIKTLLLVPIEHKGKKSGLILIGVQKEHNPTDIELNLLSTIADQMAIAIENANVYEKEREALKKLIDIDNMKTELISMVSHELRTPITSIKGFLSHFVQGTTGPVNEQQKKFLNIMDKESLHLLQLVDNLLEFSRVEHGGLKAKNEKLKIDTIVQGIIAAIEPQLTSRNVTVTLDLKSGSAEFMGDDMRIGQVIKNLIGNSLKFTKDSPKIDIKTSVKGSSIEVRVRDDGIGMDKDQLGKIFNKFYQADSALTRRFGGMGLGLAISREIVEAHGGKIWAESEGPEKGSTFIFTLPVIK